MMPCGLRYTVTFIHWKAFYFSACLFFMGINETISIRHIIVVNPSNLVHLCCSNKRPETREFIKEHKIERPLSVKVFMLYFIILEKGRAE